MRWAQLTWAQIEHAAPTIGGAFIVVLILIGLDQALLAAERRGWINYRRKGLSRPGAIYHTFELHSVFDPAVRQVIEVRHEESEEEDYSGAPPAGNSPPDVLPRDGADGQRRPDTTT